MSMDSGVSGQFNCLQNRLLIALFWAESIAYRFTAVSELTEEALGSNLRENQEKRTCQQSRVQCTDLDYPPYSLSLLQT